MTKESAEGRYERLYYKYAHVGCPAARMEDNCAHPDRCAENGRCIDLGPDPFVKNPPTEAEADREASLYGGHAALWRSNYGPTGRS